MKLPPLPPTGTRVQLSRQGFIGKLGTVIQKEPAWGLSDRSLAVKVDGDPAPFHRFFLIHVERVFTTATGQERPKRRQSVHCEFCYEPCKRRTLCYHCGRMVCGHCWSHACGCRPSHRPTECRDLDKFHRFGLSFINARRAEVLLEPLKKIKTPCHPKNRNPRARLVVALIPYTTLRDRLVSLFS